MDSNTPAEQPAGQSASTAAAPAPEHILTVSTDAAGRPRCNPAELLAKAGDKVTWAGIEHHGQVEGKILGAKQKGFTEAELPLLAVDKSKIPFTGAPAGFWSTFYPTLSIDAKAEAGAYKYSVTVTAADGTKQMLDPIIIVDEGT